ncbi:MATE family efflux transporter [Nostoc sp. 'Peltigera membranacea cyanobiont' 213]|uniref:MATE family efflux transporter n=1 Tax=Nostoc sp. 'Peltigera membranacea cyanobiont' 213 TaxID=2014530 RepID=UPI000B957ED6|nr:MATE family efflux transporter [Nostoc sp. 'Peltigera membranacea cyanobiont' 213]OYD89602.1 MATE family efflux transporter [Nostoc sp. 'Peltigera membranacea cyanobiont' 213]
MELASKEFKSELILEVQACLQLAVPLVITQILEAGIPLLDGVMMGLLNSQALAAGALGAVTFSTLASVCRSILSAVGVSVANAFGGGKIDQVSRATGQGIWLAVTMCLPVMFIIWHFDYILLLTGQEESNVLLAQTYLRSIVWSFPAALGFCILKEVSSALNRPQFLAVITVSGLFLNAVANYVLMFGKFGFPALGLAGIGWGSTLIFWLNFIAAVSWVCLDDYFKDYQLHRALHQFDKDMFVDIFQTGWFLGLQYGAEIGVFTATALMMGWFGTETLAAHEITVETESFVETVSIGISYAITMRVGQLRGQNDLKGASIAGFVCIALVTPIVTIVGLIFLLFPNYIVAMYLDTSNLDNVEIVKTATSFLAVGALVQIFYSIQTIAAGALIGLKDTKIPVLIAMFAYWGVGLGGGYLMTFTLGWGAIGLWLGLALGLLMGAVLLTWRFYLLTSDIASKSCSET